jgi:hypothetical protein
MAARRPEVISEGVADDVGRRLATSLCLSLDLPELVVVEQDVEALCHLIGDCLSTVAPPRCPHAPTVTAEVARMRRRGARGTRPPGPPARRRRARHQGAPDGPWHRRPLRDMPRRPTRRTRAAAWSSAAVSPHRHIGFFVRLGDRVDQDALARGLTPCMAAHQLMREALRHGRHATDAVFTAPYPGLDRVILA